MGGELARSDKPIPVGGGRTAAGNDEEGALAVSMVPVPARGLMNVAVPLWVAGCELMRVPAGDGRVLLLSDCVHNAGPRPQLAVRRI